MSRHIVESQLARTAAGLFVPANLLGAPERILSRPLSPEAQELVDIAGRWGMVMENQGWQQTLAWQRQSGTLFNTYTAVKSVINPDALWDMARNYLQPGRMLRAFIAGAVSNIVTTPGLMNFQVKIGAVAAFDTGNIQLNATAHVTLPFWLDILMTCDSIGSGVVAKLRGLAQATGIMFTRTAGQTDDAQGMQTILAPQTAPGVGTGFDSTIANLVDLWAGFTISNVGNGVQIHQYKLVSLT